MEGLMGKVILILFLSKFSSLVPTATSSTQKNSDRVRDKNRQFNEKEMRSRYLKKLIDPDKQIVPIDQDLKGFSFIEKSELSAKVKKKSINKKNVFSLSPKSKSYWIQTFFVLFKYSRFSIVQTDNNAEKRAKLAKLWINLNKYLLSPKNTKNLRFK